MDRVIGWVAIGGSHPLGELTLYGDEEGLFRSDEDASRWGNEHLAQIGDWWIAPIFGSHEQLGEHDVHLRRVPR